MRTISFFLALAFFSVAGGLGLAADAPAPSQAPWKGPGPGAAASGGFEVRVRAPGAGVIADAVLQEAIDEVAAVGGGVVLLGAGDFKLSRRATGDETVVIKSGVTLRGQGFSTHIFLDPTTPPNPLRYFPVRIGTSKVPAHNVVIEHLRYTGNDKAIGGGSIMGFNARLDEPESLLLSCDNVSIRHCWIYDAKQAAGCTKPATNIYNAKRVITAQEAAEASKAGAGQKLYSDADRLATQFKNWQVCHNYIDTCGNKGVELAECNGGLIADNYITNVQDGPQVIFGSRNVQIRDNVVYFTATGINITEGSNHIRVSGNHVEPIAGIKPSVPGGCLTFRTEPLPMQSTISDIVVTGNIFRNQTTNGKCAMRFQTRDEALSCTYQGITITGNVFDGDVQFLDKRNPKLSTIKDVVFADNVCEGDVMSVPHATMVSSRVMVRGNMLRKAGVSVLSASGWVWSGNVHAAGTVQIAEGAKGNVVLQNVVNAVIVDEGVGSEVGGNVVREDGKF